MTVLIGAASAQSLIIKGTYNYGLQITENGFTRTSVSTGLIITKSTNNNNNDPVLNVNSTGTLNWNGGVIKCAGTIYFRPSSIIRINNGSLLFTNPSAHFIRSQTTDIEIRGISKIGGAIILYQPPAVLERPDLIHSNFTQATGRNGYALLLYGNDTSALGTDQPIIIISTTRIIINNNRLVCT